jgi:hypothetical protein
LLHFYRWENGKVFIRLEKVFKVGKLFVIQILSYGLAIFPPLIPNYISRKITSSQFAQSRVENSSIFI